MDHLHIRLPPELKRKLKVHCRDQNIAVTSAIIIMIARELHEHSLIPSETDIGQPGASYLGFMLQQ